MPRYNNIERIGVNRTATVIEEDFEWIFREQSIADVGIDAIVEECNQGDPTGRFLALQIKAGAGNVYTHSKGFTYYISNVHYHYWMKLDMPILLVLCIKKKKTKLYWAYLSKENIQKTKTRWKIELPLNQELNTKYKNKIKKILSINKNKRIKLDFKQESNNNFKALAKGKAINYVIESINLILDYTNILTKNLKELAKKFDSPNLEPESKFAIINQVSYVFSPFASRLHNEIHIYSELFTEFIIGAKTLFTLFADINTAESKQEINNFKVPLKILIQSLNTGKEGALKMKVSVEKAEQTINSLGFKEQATHIRKSIITLEQLIEEMAVSQQMTQNLLNYIKTN